MTAAMRDTVNGMLAKLNLTSKSATTAITEPTADEVKQLKTRYEEAKQDHVFHFYDALDLPERASLFAQLSLFDPLHINEITKKALQPQASTELDVPVTLEPLPQSATASVIGSEQDDLDAWYQDGLELISQNKVGVVLMAGGQGTRLGSSAPKGCYDIGLPSKKSLFQLQAERIIKVQELAARTYNAEEVIVPWYVMTSGPTRDTTQKFFEEHSYFGLKKENVVVFEQGILPCVSNDGKILLESKSSVRVYIYCPSHAFC